MSKDTQLTKKQLDVIGDLISSDQSEKEVLQNNNISLALYCKWLSDENFINEFDSRIAISMKRNAARLAHSISKAVETLISISEQKDDLARKTCLDIIALQKHILTNQPPIINKKSKQIENPQTNISDEAAGKILAALADDKDD